MKWIIDCYQVEYDFQDTPYGRRAMAIKSFKTKEEADAFAKTQAETYVIGVYDIEA